MSTQFPWYPKLYGSLDTPWSPLFPPIPQMWLPPDTTLDPLQKRSQLVAHWLDLTDVHFS